MSAPKTNFDAAQPLDDALDTLAGDGLTWAPVLDDQRRERLLGTVSVTGILAAYRGGLRRTVRRASGLAIGSVLIEVQVTATSPLTCPSGTFVIAAQRDVTRFLSAR